MYTLIRLSLILFYWLFDILKLLFIFKNANSTNALFAATASFLLYIFWGQPYFSIYFFTLFHTFTWNASATIVYWPFDSCFMRASIIFWCAHSIIVSSFTATFICIFLFILFLRLLQQYFYTKVMPLLQKQHTCYFLMPIITLSWFWDILFHLFSYIFSISFI